MLLLKYLEGGVYLIKRVYIAINRGLINGIMKGAPRSDQLALSAESAMEGR
jgi:hypothetical protein